MDDDRRPSRFVLTLERGQLYALVAVLVAAAIGLYALGVVTGKRLTVIAGGNCKENFAAVDKAAELEKALKPDHPDAGPPLKELVAAVRDAVDSKPAEAKPEPVPAEPKKIEKPAPPPVEKPKPEKEPVKTPAPGPAIKEPPVKEPPRKEYKTVEPSRMEPLSTPSEPAAVEYTVQVVALPDRNQAVALAAQLERKGYATHISTTQVPGKGTMYRVRVGKFKTKEEANSYRLDFEAREKRSGFVTTVK
jgi:cell division septation protein DedD